MHAFPCSTHACIHAGSDFDSTILQTVIRAGIGISITTRFDIPIIAQENNVEPTEVFLVLLNVTGAEEETIVFAGRCAIGIIRGDVAATQTGIYNILYRK